MKKDNWGVHSNHCCLKHGCKYGDENCPVEEGKVEQEFPCEYCTYNRERNLENIDDFVSFGNFLHQKLILKHLTFGTISENARKNLYDVYGRMWTMNELVKQWINEQ